jgi:hypothetical protein
MPPFALEGVIDNRSALARMRTINQSTEGHEAEAPAEPMYAEIVDT